MSNIEKLALIGQALYGQSWKSEMAKSLGYDYRRIQHWMTGSRPMPDDIWPKLEILVEQRQDELNKIKALL